MSLEQYSEAADPYATTGPFPTQFVYTCFFSRRNANLRVVLPLFMRDIDRSMAVWGLEGRFDPFEDIYNVNISLIKT